MLVRDWKLPQLVTLALAFCVVGANQNIAPAVADEGLTRPVPAIACSADMFDAPEIEDAADEGEALSEFGGIGDYNCGPSAHALAPNAIGDAFGNHLTVTTALGTVGTVQQGGSGFKASSNNNAIPQDRVYYNYHYLSAPSQVAPTGGPAVDVDLQQHLFGFEKLLIGDIYAIGVQIPVQHQLASDLNTGVAPTATDIEIGNLTVYSKHILYQSWRTTLSAGFALGIPTGDELVLTAGDTIHIENDAWTLTPYVATLFYDPCNCYYFQIFGQFDIPLDDNEVYINGTRVGDIKDVMLFRLDGSAGYWLSRDCCGNGVVAIAELHFATSLDGDDSVVSGANIVTYDDSEQLNATLGLGIIKDCWSLYPGIALPLLDSPDRGYDWQAQILLQRRL